MFKNMFPITLIGNDFFLITIYLKYEIDTNSTVKQTLCCDFKNNKRY